MKEFSIGDIINFIRLYPSSIHVLKKERCSALRKETLKSQAYSQIKEKIIKGDFRADGYTSENKLVAELGMSRTPIREALHRLQSEGFVKILPKQGIVIQEPSIKETNDYYELRLAIETFAIRKLKGLITEEDFAKLGSIIDNQKKACELRDYSIWMEHDIAFHALLLEIVGNRLFIQLMSNIRDRLSKDIFKRRELFQEGINEHIEILKALKRGDYIRAEQALTEHILGGKMRHLAGGEI